MEIFAAWLLVTVVHDGEPGRRTLTEIATHCGMTVITGRHSCIHCLGDALIRAHLIVRYASESMFDKQAVVDAVRGHGIAASFDGSAAGVITVVCQGEILALMQCAAYIRTIRFVNNVSMQRVDLS
jgi:hypothetical protein